MVASNVEVIEIVTGRPCVPESISCPRCSALAPSNDSAHYEFRKGPLHLEFVFPGWVCSRCNKSFAPDETLEQINKILAARLVALGLRPPINMDRVKEIRATEAQRRERKPKG